VLIEKEEALHVLQVLHRSRGGWWVWTMAPPAASQYRPMALKLQRSTCPHLVMTTRRNKDMMRRRDQRR
jgi:hypothetical protein